MTELSYSDLRRQAGTGALPAAVGEAARRVWCGILAAAPQAIIPGGLDNPINQWMDGVYNEMCTVPGEPPPPRPTLPFPGGQCPTQYLVSGVFHRRDGLDLPFNVLVGGPVGAPFLAGGVNGLPKRVKGYYVSAVNIFSGNREKIALVTFDESDADGSYLASINVVRADGGPDNCGTPPPSYSLTNRPTPPPNPYQPTLVPVPVAPGGPNITLPLVFAPILIRPTANFRINPTLKASFGPFNLNFGLGGVKISISPTANVTVNFPGADSYYELPPDPEEYDVYDGSDPDYVNILNEIKACACGSEPTTVTLTQTAESGILNAPPGYIILCASLGIVTKPPNQRTQWGGTDAPRLEWSGWYSFGASAGWGERFRFDRANCFAFAGAGTRFTRFTWTTYRGGTAQAAITCINKRIT